MTNTTTRVLSVALASMLAMATFSLYTFQAAAYGDHRTSINVSSEASVSNNVSVEADTGDNDAHGSSGGRGGDGGDAYRGDGGDGGDAGSGGDGGDVTTGDATAIGTINNDVNRTDIRVEDCGCDEEEDEVIEVLTRLNIFDDNDRTLRVATNLDADVRNNLSVEAETGNNEVDGGRGGSGGDGGDVRRDNNRSWLNWLLLFEDDSTSGGDAGNGGPGGDGGTVNSGDALADGLVDNVVNRTVIRVEHDTDEDEA